MIDRLELQTTLDALLQPDRFKDYCANGLQVEGRQRVRKIVSGVTASRALIEAAIAEGADTILVHHGLFWRGHDGRVTGWMRQRLGLLLAHDINLFAYHLPLDAHPEFGNNVQLGLRMGWQASGRFGEQDLGCLGATDDADAQTLAQRVEAGADAFITGEISEPQFHLARECGVAFLACGHHATERYGAPALAAHVALQFGLDHQFIDIDNPA